MRNEVIPFKPHPCINACVAKWENQISLVKSVNPLLMPVLHGWQRHICHQSKTMNTGAKKWVNYISPCGRMLRSTGEVDQYLYLTNSRLTIDMFSFDYYIHTDREFEANAKFLKIDDITLGKEVVPISSVNCVDTIKPDNIEYSAHRIPLEGVPLNPTEDTLEGCQCTDNCRDRSKCSCWRKTFEATTFISKEMNTNVGYRGRRLPDIVNTGIFECNSKCKCDCRCSNRVVQNGVSVRLQLFRTYNKGWGLRCLDDIAKGAFICTYAGHLMTEDQSDIRGQELGDEYFAELDFIECLMKLRENYRLNSDDEDDNDDDTIYVKNSSHRPKVNSSFALPKKNPISLNSTIGHIETIYLDSDEDDQDRHDRQHEDIIVSNSKEVDFNKKRALNREEKERRVATSINSNRFFTNKNNQFFFRDFFKDPAVYIMDAKICGNIGRYFNHSCSPNIFVQNVFVDTYDLRFPWIAFFSLHSIKAGTELCWDYNYTIDSVKGRTLYCYCNSTNCRGRLL